MPLLIYSVCSGLKHYKLYITYLGNASKNHVRLVCGNATRIPDIKAEWRTTAATSYRDARSTVGTVPMLWPYNKMFSGDTPYCVRSAVHALSISEYKFFSEGFPELKRGWKQVCVILIFMNRVLNYSHYLVRHIFCIFNTYLAPYPE